MPQAGAGTAPGQPPFGSSQVQAPTPNRGLQAKSMEKVKVAVRLLELALPELGASTPQGQAVMKAITSLSRQVGQGAPGGGVEKSELQSLMLNAKQQQPMMDMLRAQGAGGPAAGMTPPGAPGAGGGAPAPMPTPTATGA